jgi:hypothetical protein
VLQEVAKVALLQKIVLRKYFMTDQFVGPDFFNQNRRTPLKILWDYRCGVPIRLALIFFTAEERRAHHDKI